MPQGSGGAAALTALIALVGVALVVALGSQWAWGTEWGALHQLNADNALGVVLRYVECEHDCADDLARMADFPGGEAAIIPVLDHLLHQGPPANRLHSYERGLRETYRTLATQEASSDNPRAIGTEDEYVETYLNTYQQHYQTAIIRALESLGSPAAATALGPLAVGTPVGPQ
jgi:hypothetical protein